MFKFKATQSRHLTIFDETYGYGYCLLGECRNLPCVGILDYGLSRYTINALAEVLEREEVVENATISDIPPAQRALVYTNRTGAVGKIQAALAQEGFTAKLGDKKFAKRTMFLPPSQMPCTGVYHLQEAVERTYRQRVNTMLHCSKTIGDVYTCAHYNTTKAKSPFTIVRVRLSERASEPQAVTAVMQEWFEKLFPDNLLVKMFCEGRELEFGFFTSPSIIENILLEHPVFPADKIDGYQVVTFEFNTPITEAWVGLLRDKFLRTGAGISCIKESGNDITMEIPCAYDAGGVNGRAFESRFRFIERILEEEHEPQRAVLAERRGLRVVESYAQQHVGLYSSPPQPVGYTRKVLSVHESKLPLLFSMPAEAPDSLLEVTEYGKAKRERRDRYLGAKARIERNWKEQRRHKEPTNVIALEDMQDERASGCKCQTMKRWLHDTVFNSWGAPDDNLKIYPDDMTRTLNLKQNQKIYTELCAQWKKAYYESERSSKKEAEELLHLKKAYDQDVVALRKKHSIKDSYDPPTQLQGLEEAERYFGEGKKIPQEYHTKVKQMEDAWETEFEAGFYKREHLTKKKFDLKWQKKFDALRRKYGLRPMIFVESYAVIRSILSYLKGAWPREAIAKNKMIQKVMRESFDPPTQLQGLEEGAYPEAYWKDYKRLQNDHVRKSKEAEKVIKWDTTKKHTPTKDSKRAYEAQMQRIFTSSKKKHQALVKKYKLPANTFFDYGSSLHFGEAKEPRLQGLEEVTYPKAYKKERDRLENAHIRRGKALKKGLKYEDTKEWGSQATEKSWTTYVLQTKKLIRETFRKHQALIKSYGLPVNAYFDYTLGTEFGDAAIEVKNGTLRFVERWLEFEETYHPPTQLQGLEEVFLPCREDVGVATALQELDWEKWKARFDQAWNWLMSREQKLPRDVLSELEHHYKIVMQSMLQRAHEVGPAAASACINDVRELALWAEGEQNKWALKLKTGANQYESEVFLPCREGNFLSAVKRDSQIDIYQGVFAGHTMQPKIVEDYYPTLVSYGTEGFPG